MKVKVEYKNKNLEVVGSDYFEFDLYAQKLAQDILSVLTDIEKYLECNEFDYDSDNMYRYIRRKLLNTAGALKRLPDNIVQDKSYPKATKKSIISMIKGD